MTTIIQSSIIAINKDFTSHSFLKGGIKPKGCRPLALPFDTIISKST
nr:MAG TPA: hypothetical protein [Caudoviricetes sp.]